MSRPDRHSRSDSSELAVTPILVQSVSGPPGTALGALLDRERHFPGEYLRALIRPFDFIVANITASSNEAEELVADLPAGEARAEALAVRLRRKGARLERGEPVALHSARQLESLCYSRGRSSAAIVRADPSLVSEMQIGAWFEAGWRGRLARRALRRIPRLASCLRALLRRPGSLRMAADAWFWAGVRRGTSAQEWRRLTRSSYVVLCYHRLAGEGKESERELDIAPGQFERQMRALRLLRFHPLSPSELLAFHSDPAAVLPRRRFVVTADDAYLDAVACLERNARLQPQVFALTALVDGAPRPPDQAPLADWKMLDRAGAAGVAVGSHTRHHVALAGLGPDELSEEIDGSLRDLERSLPRAIPVLAYPYGRCDEAAREATIAAGYQAAYTTNAGRNGAGSDRWCLRRISIQFRNSVPSFLWKVISGEALPARWERRLVAREARSRRRKGRRG